MFELRPVWLLLAVLLLLPLLAARSGATPLETNSPPNLEDYIELAYLRRENVKIFRHRDNPEQQYLVAGIGPLHYWDGRWHDPVLTFADRDRQLAIEKSGVPFRIDREYPGSLYIDTGRGDIALTPLGVAHASGIVERVRDVDRVTFRSVLPDVDITYVAGGKWDQGNHHASGSWSSQGTYIRFGHRLDSRGLWWRSLVQRWRYGRG